MNSNPTPYIFLLLLLGNDLLMASRFFSVNLGGAAPDPLLLWLDAVVFGLVVVWLFWTKAPRQQPVAAFIAGIFGFLGIPLGMVFFLLFRPGRTLPRPAPASAMPDKVSAAPADRPSFLPRRLSVPAEATVHLDDQKNTISLK